MHLTISDADYLERLEGHLRSVGFDVVTRRRTELEVLGLAGSASEAADELEPFLRVWARLYPDVGVELHAFV
jgi:hypothetical protein